QNTSRIKKFLTNDIRESFNENEHVFGELQNFIDPEIHNWAPLCQAQYIEISLFMSGYLLSSQGDRMMMGNSVEGRFPFLDHRIVEFASTIPPNYKLNGLNEKYLLKQTFADLIPKEISKRPKQPYRAPVSKCFLPEHGSLSSKLLSKESLSGSKLFDTNSVSMLMDKVTNASTAISESDDMAIAAIVSTQLLYHNFISEITDNNKPMLRKSET
ncbi:MAG: asparagine synthase C-terminal domain-containing protein, partial [Fibrobacter sp.]|nr:asparagine synthase C-terminal domain-containing protein [Fibrobacter sp.]